MTSPLDISKIYTQRGWSVVPIPHKEKAPTLKGWQKLRLTIDELADHFGDEPQNIGVILGEASSGLVDVDLDCPEAIEVAAHLLPTTSTFGRASKPRSHYLYVAPSAKTAKFADPVDHAMLLELRSNGAQTVFPSSVHPSGENVEWSADATEPATCGADELHGACAKAAAAALLSRHWPAVGSRHDAALHLGGALSRAGWTRDDVEAFVRATTTAAHCQDVDEHARSAADAVDKVARGESVTGWPSLAEMVTDKVIDKVRLWLRAVGGDDRATIVVTTRQREVNDAGISLLAADPRVFARTTGLAHVVHDPTIWKVGKDKIKITGARIVELSNARMSEILSEGADYVQQTKKGEQVSCRPPGWSVEQIAARGEWPTIRSLVGVTDCPFVRPDGSICQDAGYDSETAVLLECSAEFPRVGELPTQEDARAALADLSEIFTDFPHVSESHRMVPVAAILTIMARHAIEGPTPLFVFESNVRGAGKGLQCDTIGIIATGRETPKLSYPTSEEELDKVLASIAMSGRNIIDFDNVARPLGGTPLDKVLTATDEVQLRVLGRTEDPIVKWRTVILASGNNIEMSGDTARRTFICRLESMRENPELRPVTEFKFHPLTKHVRKNRARYVVDALTILRAHAVAGRPSAGVAELGSFNAWSKVVASAIAFAGGADVMRVRENVETLDANKGALTVLLQNWSKIDLQGHGLTVSEFIEKVWPPGQRDYFDTGSKSNANSNPFPGVREAIESVVKVAPGRAPSSLAVAGRFRSWVSRVVGGRQLVQKGLNRTHVVLWGIAAIAGDAGAAQQSKRDDASAGDAGDAGVVQAHARFEFGEEDNRKSNGQRAGNTPAGPASPAASKVRRKRVGVSP